MTRTAPRLTTELLDRALAVPPSATAPTDLHVSIAATIREVGQSAGPARDGLGASFARLPLPVRLALTMLLLVAFIVGLAAVGAQLLRHRTPIDDSLTFRGDAARTGVVEGPGPGRTMSLAFTRTLPGQIVMSPAIVDGVAYAGAVDGRFRAIDLRRGAEIWAADLSVAWSSPSVTGDLVVVGTEDRELVAIHRSNGEQEWRIPIGGFVAGSPTIAADRLYVTTSSTQSRGHPVAGATGNVVALDLATGAVAWQEDLPGPSTRSIAVDGSILVAPTDVGIAEAFDTATGHELWRFSTGAFTDTPVIAGDMVFLAGLDPEGTDGRLWAVDLKSGKEVWHHTRPSHQTIIAPAVDGAAGIVYAGTVDGDVIARRADDGSEVWTQHLGAEIDVPPTKSGDTLYVASTGGVTALDATTGAPFGTVPIDGIPSAPAIADGYLVTGTQSGTLYVLVGTDVPPVISPRAAPSIVAITPTPTAGLASTAPLEEVWARAPEDLGVPPRSFVNIAPDGRLWVADSRRGGFTIVDPDGEVVDFWQPTGEAALDLVQPDNDLWGAIAFAEDGDFYVADTDHQRVLRFNAQRELIGSWGTFGPGPGQFLSPFGITVGPDGLVYVVDDPSCRVEVFDPSGGYVRTLAGGPEFVDRCTNDVLVDPDGNVYVASGGRGAAWGFTVFDRNGRVLRRIGEGLLREPVLLAAGPHGEIYATDGTDRLHVFDPTGFVIASWSGRELELAVIGPEDQVYATGESGVLRRYSLPRP